MRRRNTIRLAILAVVLTSAFFVFNSTASTGKNKTCRETMEPCCKKKRGATVNAGWESLSQHFFSSI
ncbi:MAG: hypothetical protein E6H09_08445 [Bacteroidetes bacterium]|nr:MAG: hypothetical protein E6H09_08445 [Bacteroidota bacterium]